MRAKRAVDSDSPGIAIKYEQRPSSPTEVAKHRLLTTAWLSVAAALRRRAGRSIERGLFPPISAARTPIVTGQRGRSQQVRTPYEHQLRVASFRFSEYK
jgi:hypothetical protein